MSTLHMVYIPAVFLAGLWIGYYFALKGAKEKGASRTLDDELRDYDG